MRIQQRKALAEFLGKYSSRSPEPYEVQLQKLTPRQLILRIGTFLGLFFGTRISNGSATDQSLASACGECIFSWAYSGFPDPVDTCHRYTQLLAILLIWLFPGDYQICKENMLIWAICASLSLVLGLYNLTLYAWRKGHLRVICRCFYPSIQNGLLRATFQNPGWARYLDDLWATYWCTSIGPP